MVKYQNLTELANYNFDRVILLILIYSSQNNYYVYLTYVYGIV